MPAAIQPVMSRGAQEVEHEINRRQLAGDVILKKGIEPLITDVNLRGQGNEDDVQVETLQAQSISQPGQAIPVGRIVRGEPRRFRRGAV